MGEKNSGRAKRSSERDIDELAEDLVADKYRVRRTAIGALAQIGGDRAIRLICDALKDPRKSVRSRAAYCLGRMRSSDTLEALADALHDRTADVRKQAVLAVGSVGHVEDAVILLLPMLADTEAIVIQAVIEVCGGFRNPRMVEPLLSAANGRSPIIQDRIVLALGPQRDLRTVRFLCTLAKSGAQSTRSNAIRELRAMGESQALPRALLTAHGLPARYRLEALEALRTVRIGGWFFTAGLVYPLPPIPEYCARIAAGDSDLDVRRGAHELLEYGNLLRGSEPQGVGGDVLLRAAAGSPKNSAQDGLLIAASREDLISPQPRIGILRRLFKMKI